MNQDAVSYAKTQAELIKKQQQYQIDQAKLAESERIKALELAKQQQMNQITLQKTKEEESAKGLQQQEYLQKMLNQKQLNENLVRNGLGQTGVRETSINNLYANYGENVNKINADKLSALRDLAQNENDVESTYGQNVSTVLSEEAIRRAQIQSAIDENALNQYNTAYAQYIAQKQYEDSLKQQQEQNRLSWASLKNSTGSGSSGTGEFDDTKITTQQTSTSYAYGNSESIQKSKDYYFSNGYQPRYVENVKLKETGKTIGQIFGNSLGSDRTKQNIWIAGNKYYVWLGQSNGYKDVTSEVTKYLALSTPKKAVLFGGKPVM